MAVASAATPAVRRRPYTMAELLAESDYRQPSMAEERVWVNSPAVGRKSL
jgi:antitoxin ChpS